MTLYLLTSAIRERLTGKPAQRPNNPRHVRYWLRKIIFDVEATRPSDDATRWALRCKRSSLTQLQIELKIDEDPDFYGYEL